MYGLQGKNHWFKSGPRVGSWLADVLLYRSKKAFKASFGSAFHREVWSSLRGLFGDASEVIFGICFGRVSRRGFGGAIGNGFVMSFGQCFGDRGHNFWPASGFFLGPVLEHFFFKIDKKMVQKMGKIFAQNLGTIFAQNLGTGIGMHVKCKHIANPASPSWDHFLGKNLGQILRQFWSRTAPAKPFLRVPRGRQIAKYRDKLGIGLSSPLRVLLGMGLEVDLPWILEVGLGMCLENFCAVDSGLPLN